MFKRVSVVHDEDKGSSRCASHRMCTYFFFCTKRLYLRDIHWRKMNPVHNIS